MISLFHLGTHNLSQCQFVNLFGNFSLLCGLTVPGGLKNPLKNKLFTIILANSAHSKGQLILKLGLDRTGHMSFLTGQDRTPKFAGQVLPDWTESGLTFLNILPTK